MTVIDECLFDMDSIWIEDYELRPLRRNDYGLVSLLSELTEVGEISEQAFTDRFDLLKLHKSSYVIVIVNKNRIVACATLVIENKFIHQCSNVGHIEDVVVGSTERGKRLGIVLIDQLKKMAQLLHCYKVTLNCNERNVGFYKKSGLIDNGIQMVHYYHE
ncbi:acyl-CoA N-acyltransferase [Pilobolus umbonatus]|nr:acyl-CoA N-acyltransferase [Pilobolus umbonatus]